MELAAGLEGLNTLLVRTSGGSGGDERNDSWLAFGSTSSSMGELEENGFIAPALGGTEGPSTGSLRLRFFDESEQSEAAVGNGGEEG